MKKINGIIMQYFEWYMECNQNLWNTLAESAEKLAKQGITAEKIKEALNEFKACSDKKGTCLIEIPYSKAYLIVGMHNFYYELQKLEKEFLEIMEVSDKKI